MLFINTNDVAVLLIDMQDYFLNEEKRKLIPNQIAVIKECKKNDVPIVVLEYSGCGETTSELQKELKGVSNCHKLIKSSDSAFGSTRIDNLLRQLKAKTLLLMGINACACVLETGKDAVRNGYEVVTSDMIIGGYCPSCGKSNPDSWYEKNVKFLQNHLPVFQKAV